MHVNSEWVVLEGVDAHGHPARPGELSHTVLLTNLANWLQPIIRYDLGDRVTALGSPCACGNPLPAFRVEGRTGEALSLRSPRGAAVRLPPLALETVMEEATGAERFQLAQTAPDRLVVRLDGGAAKSRAAAWRRSSRALRAYLAAQSLAQRGGGPRPRRAAHRSAQRQAAQRGGGGNVDAEAGSPVEPGRRRGRRRAHRRRGATPSARVRPQRIPAPAHPLADGRAAAALPQPPRAHPARGKPRVGVLRRGGELRHHPRDGGAECRDRFRAGAPRGACGRGAHSPRAGPCHGDARRQAPVARRGAPRARRRGAAFPGRARPRRRAAAGGQRPARERGAAHRRAVPGGKAARRASRRSRAPTISSWALRS